MPVTDSNTNAEKEQPQALQTVTYVPQSPQQFEDDTIDLYELWITLWNKKWLVIAVTVIAALGSVVYALNAPQIYKPEHCLFLQLKEILNQSARWNCWKRSKRMECRV